MVRGLIAAEVVAVAVAVVDEKALLPMATPNFFRIDLNGPAGRGLPRIEHDASDTAVSGAQDPRGYAAFEEPTGRFTAGVWACDAGELRIENLEIDEACYVVEGEVIVTDEAGASERFVAGDAFVLPKGFTGRWVMPAAFKKYNAMYRR